MADFASQQPEPTQRMQEHVRSSTSAAQLRAEFDRSFALRVQEPSGEMRDFIIVQVAGREFAIAARGLSSIERTGDAWNGHAAGAEELLDAGGDDPVSVTRNAPEWVRVPSNQPSLLGIRAVNGRIVPGFSLATLLGFGAPAEAGYCAMVFVGLDMIALAFDALLRFARVGPEQMLPAGPAAEPWQTGTLLDEGKAFAVIGVASLLQVLASGQSVSNGASTPARQDGKR